MHGIVDRFCKRKYLRRKHTIRIASNDNRKYVYLDDPLVLARLAGHLKHNLGQPDKGYQIFMRGQANDHRGMVPSIFRNHPNTSNNYSNRMDGYNELIFELRQRLKLKRFDGEIGGAILQHYGIRTRWVDFVDNLFVALWFATRKRSEVEPFRYVQKEGRDYGWIYFIQVENPLNEELEHAVNRESAGDFVESGFAKGSLGIAKGRRTEWCDLRCYQTSLSLRAHTQHGIFASKRGWSETDYDLNEFIVATVKFPVRRTFLSMIDELNIFSVKYMFPSPYYDNTYKILRRNRITELIPNVERNNNLEEGELGRIHKYE